MSDPDLAELRRIAEAARDDWGSPVPTLGLRAFHEATYPPAVLALLDRIESLEAERDEYRKQADCWSLAEQEVQALEARIARVKALHRKEPARYYGTDLNPSREFDCAGCGEGRAWPCATIRAAADEQEADR